ncbi:MAG: autotransporter-associated beta strand repeat-containing protein [Phycisphaerae bacterium]|nr:autotransporter-associated beta strand repeat-containing protein [Phycisphaerae bacterium]
MGSSMGCRSHRQYIRRAIAVAVVVCAILPPAPAPGAEDVYIFSYFRDPDGTDGMHLAYSLDGYNYHAVNGDIAVTGPMMGTTTRDPCINLGPDGKFRLVHTTLPWDVTTQICYGESDDLLTWTNKKCIDVMAGYANTRNAWAPELFFDMTTSRYMIYWSSRENVSGAPNHIYYTMTTDFETFTPTALLYDPGYTVIDMIIVKDSANHVGFVKNETGLYVFKAQGGPDATGPYNTVNPPRISGDYAFEGPTGIKIGDAWFLYGDRYGENRMGLLTSNDNMQTWAERVNDLIFPTRGKHGTVIKVPRMMAQKLIVGAPNATSEIEFDGHAGTLDYQEGGNWLGGAVPNASQTAVIQSGYTADLSSSASTVSKLHIGQTSAGTLVVSGSAVLSVSGEIRVGRVGTISNAGGTLRISGGTVNASDVVRVEKGEVCLEEGVLSAPAVHGDFATALHFNGGILKANNSSGSLVFGLGTADIQVGGAAIDTNGHNVTLSQPLIGASATGGLTKIGPGVLTLTAANTYRGSTTIADGILRLSSPPMAVTHRWSFNGSLIDSAGGSNATLVEVGANSVTLSANDATVAGGSRNASDYIRLGNNLLPDANVPISIELWATQRSVQNWGRIFDFGATNSENLFMSWTRGTNASTDRVEWKDGVTTTSDDTNQPYTLNAEFHIVMTLSPVGDSTVVTWYTAPSASADLGAAQDSFTTTNTLATLTDTANNLARSFWTPDSTANASYNEVRMWNGALTPTILEQLHDAGPNANLGTINYGAPGSLPSNTAVNMTNAGTAFDLNGIHQTIGSLAGVSSSLVVLGGAMLTVGGDGTSTTFAGEISGSGGITKTGTGTLQLNGHSTYSGGTTVQSGVLLVNGSIAGGATVQNSGTLGGTGSIAGGLVIQTGGTLIPGPSIASLDVVGDAGIAGLFKVDYGPSSIDLLAVGGQLDISAATVDFDGLGVLNSTSSYVFAQYHSLVGTRFASVKDLPPTHVIAYHYGGNSLALVPYVRPDLDRDADVDADDCALLRQCTTGPAIIPVAPGCEDADLDADDDVDQDDFGVLQRCYSGSNVSADPDCAN